MSEAKCAVCARAFKNAAGLAIHNRKCKAEVRRSPPAALLALRGTEPDSDDETNPANPMCPAAGPAAGPAMAAKKRGKVTAALGAIQEPSEIKDDSENAVIINLVSKIHQLMFTQDQINGKPAYEDIIKLLFLRFIQPELKNKLSDLMDTKHYAVIPDFQLEDIALLDFAHLAGLKMAANTVTYSDRITLLWDMLNKHPLTREIFLSKKFFNASMETIQSSIYLIHDALKKIKFDEMKSDIKGQIYEYFINKYSGGKDNEFGQYFTPRPLITLVINLNEKLIPEFKPVSIFDPCAGTCGFLSEMYKKIKCVPENIHGGELEPNAYAAGLMNLLLTTGSVCNLKKRDSLEYMAKTSYDWIATNPPFGKRVDYDEMYRSEKTSDYKISEIYPVKTNDASSLFLQQCMKRLNPNGICNIVLPYGKIFSAAQLLKLRVHLVEKYKLCAVIVVQQQAFDNTGCGTAVLTFTHGITDVVKFYETNTECLECKELYTVTRDQIKAANYNLLAQTYAPRAVFKLVDSTWEVKKLGEVCEFKNGKSITRAELTPGDYPVIGGGQSPLGTHNKFNKDENVILCSSTGDYSGFISQYNKKIWASDCFSIHPNKNLLNKYLFHYLKYQQELIYKLQHGATHKHVNGTDISTIDIPISSIEKQAEIIKQCETYDVQIQHLMTNIKQINELKTKYLSQFFSTIM